MVGIFSNMAKREGHSTQDEIEEFLADCVRHLKGDME
jgi:hypothetical protein